MDKSKVRFALMEEHGPSVGEAWYDLDKARDDYRLVTNRYAVADAIATLEEAVRIAASKLKAECEIQGLSVEDYVWVLNMIRLWAPAPDLLKILGEDDESC